jgi:hydroxymethylpyrimidine/phosphomethylpyrimidine kinase
VYSTVDSIAQATTTVTVQITYTVHKWHWKMEEQKQLKRRCHKIQVLNAKHKMLSATRILKKRRNKLQNIKEKVLLHCRIVCSHLKNRRN